MKKSTTISKRPLTPKNLDYDFLYNEAVRFLQKMSGDIWTDYNVHDPGVTILEYLCFAITDLGYRTNLSIEDLLYARENGKPPEIEDALFEPEIIFPSAPLTGIDYRKLLLDSIPELQNCWVEKQDTIDGQKGLNKVYLQVHDWLQSQKSKDGVGEKAKELLMNNRNLGEDFSSICFLKKQKIEIVAHLLIRYNAYAEDVLVRILTALESFFNQVIQHHPREEMLNEGMSLEEILNGPYLENGFIDSNDLKSRRRAIHIDEIRELILDVEGVLNISRLYFRKNGLSVDGTTIQFELDEYPAFSKKFLAEGEKLPITIEKDGTLVPVDEIEVKRIFNANINKTIKRFTKDVSIKHKKHETDIEVNDIGFYSSIQNLFPHIYGITKWGVPLRAPQAQKAHAKQLKGYLALFEQFFSTYLSELTFLRNWFSIEEQMHEYQGDFFPFDIPDIDPLIRTKGEGNDRERVNAQLRKKFLESSSPIEKKNAILSHLLARFNEGFSDKHFVELGMGNSSKIDHEALIKIIQAKSAFLRDYPNLSKNRGLGINYSKPAWLTENVSGLKKRLCLQLGFPDYQNRSLIMALNNSNRLEKEPQESVFEGEIYIPINTLLIYGMYESSYHIRRKEDDSGEVHFRAPGLQEEVKIYESSDLGKCKTAIENIIEEVKSINEWSTGFFIVDHILLRNNSSSEWSLRLNDENDNLLLRNSEFGDRDSLEMMSFNILFLGSEYSNFKLIQIDESCYKIGLYDEKKRVMESDEEYDYASALIQVRRIHRFIENIKHTAPDDIYERLILSKKTMENANASDEIPANFYNFQLSFVFPKWTSRFFNRQHREYIKKLVLETIPVHLKANFYWLSIRKMERFENLYKTWLDIMASEKNYAQKRGTFMRKRDEAAAELTQFLLKNK